MLHDIRRAVRHDTSQLESPYFAVIRNGGNAVFLQDGGHPIEGPCLPDGSADPSDTTHADPDDPEVARAVKALSATDHRGTPMEEIPSVSPRDRRAGYRGTVKVDGRTFHMPVAPRGGAVSGPWLLLDRDTEEVHGITYARRGKEARRSVEADVKAYRAREIHP